MRVAIIGCTHAGLSAAIQILTEQPSAQVTVYERNDNVSFLSCGIALYLSQQVAELQDMMYFSPEQLSELGARVKIQHDVLKVNTKRKVLLCQDMTTKAIFQDHYDKLIIATGSYVNVPPIIGVDDSRVLFCKGYEQAQRIKRQAEKSHTIAVIGGGYSGVEIAESFATTGHDVILIQGNDQLLNNYVDPFLSQEVVTLLREHQVKVLINDRVNAFISDGDQVGIQTQHELLRADLAILCTGFSANTELVSDQVEVDRHDAIITNRYMQTSDPDVYAAGDACVTHYNPTNADAYIPLATNAVRSGILAGHNVLGNRRHSMGTQATAALKIFDYHIATTGITLKNAQKINDHVASVCYQGNYRYSFMGTPTKITIVLVYDRQNREVLGAQLFSRHEIAQSANTISLAIQNHNTIDELAFVDMLFNPNYDQAFNYLNLVAQLAIKQERTPNK
jgi:NADPH-dependent 2,4-dienoyl-CoA reductase/sulfur reductase-like enzyme